MPENSDVPPVSGPLAAVRAALAEVVAAPAWQRSDVDLAAMSADLLALSRLAQGQAVRMLGEVAERGLPATSGAGTLATWVRQIAPATGRAEAGRVARVAERLYQAPHAERLAPTRAAVEAGRLGVDQADVVTTALHRLVEPPLPAGLVDDETLGEAQALLLADADWMDARELAALGRRLHERLDPDADTRLARDERARASARQLTLSTHAVTGLVHVDATLTPACGAALRAAIDAFSAPAPAVDGTRDTRTPAQRRHDGLQTLCEKALAAPGLLPRTHGSAYRVTVTVPLASLAAATGASADAAPGRFDVDAGEVALSRPTLQALACGAEIVPVLLDDAGHPLDVGDTQRLFTPRQRAALVARDQTCTYPGCGAPAPWCDAHHVRWVSRGGGTDLANGALLCGRHHRLVHAADLTADLVDGRVVWHTRTPDGRAVQVPPVADRAVDDLVRRWPARRWGAA